MTTDVRPAMAPSRASCTECSVWESRALVASSISSRAGSVRSVRAMATRCFWPPERFWPNLPTLVRNPCGKVSTKSVTLAAAAARQTSSSLASAYRP
mmetsp:Transcript_15581/g.44671  ORF Transcript_15581/g.44671 Transcript_15581/m.44671 type:complete len:97 (-) Transcript_15581:1483-1773(-)